MTTLIGRKIVEVRAMTPAEIKAEGWHVGRHGIPTAIVLDDGTRLYASSDEEGNDRGAIFGLDPEGRQFSLTHR